MGMKNDVCVKKTKYCKRIKQVVFAVVMALIAAVFVVTAVSRISGKTLSVFGFTVYRISSDSMQPTLRTGDIILCRDCDPTDLSEGDIITYEGVAGELAGKNVTHRVFRSPYRLNGEIYVITKGDDNPVEDTPVEVSRVKGRFVAKLKWLRFLYDFIISPWGKILLVLLLLLFIALEAHSLIKGFRARRSELKR